MKINLRRPKYLSEDGAVVIRALPFYQSGFPHAKVAHRIKRGVFYSMGFANSYTEVDFWCGGRAHVARRTPRRLTGAPTLPVCGRCEVKALAGGECHAAALFQSLADKCREQAAKEDEYGRTTQR